MTVGLLVLADFFVNSDSINALGLYLVRAASVVAAFALALGMVNVLTVHLGKVYARDRSWGYSMVLLGSLFFTLGVGFVTGGPASPQMQQLFEVVLFPLEATLFSLLGFFVVTAAFRAFRVKNFETGLFVTFAMVIKDWVLDVPALSGARGILLGVALGTVATGLRVLLGLDRPYVG
jgi:hypothetical protein